MQQLNNFFRRARDTALNVGILICTAVFALGVYSNILQNSGQAPSSDTVPFNSVLFFSLFATPILLSLTVAVVLFVVQQYRASNGTRDRGWEEQW